MRYNATGIIDPKRYLEVAIRHRQRFSQGGKTHLFHNLRDVLCRTVSRDKLYLSAFVGGSSNNTIAVYGRHGSGLGERREARRDHWKHDWEHKRTPRTSQTAPNVTPGDYPAATRLHSTINVYVLFVNKYIFCRSEVFQQQNVPFSNATNVRRVPVH